MWLLWALAAVAFYGSCTVAARHGLLEVFLVSSAWAGTIYKTLGNRRALRWSLCLAGSYALGVAWALAARIDGFNPVALGMSWMDWHKWVCITVDTAIAVWVYHAAATQWEYALERVIALSLLPSFAAFIGAIDGNAHVGWMVVANGAFIAVLLSGRPGRADAQDPAGGTVSRLLAAVAVAAKRQRFRTTWTKS